MKNKTIFFIVLSVFLIQPKTVFGMDNADTKIFDPNQRNAISNSHNTRIILSYPIRPTQEMIDNKAACVQAAIQNQPVRIVRCLIVDSELHEQYLKRLGVVGELMIHAFGQMPIFNSVGPHKRSPSFSINPEHESHKTNNMLQNPKITKLHTPTPNTDSKNHKSSSSSSSTDDSSEYEGALKFLDLQKSTIIDFNSDIHNRPISIPIDPRHESHKINDISQDQKITKLNTQMSNTDNKSHKNSSSSSLIDDSSEHEEALKLLNLQKQTAIEIIENPNTPTKKEPNQNSSLVSTTNILFSIVSAGIITYITLAVLIKTNKLPDTFTQWIEKNLNFGINSIVKN